MSFPESSSLCLSFHRYSKRCNKSDHCRCSDHFKKTIQQNQQCQRLSIARALLKDAPVILLDEATASLDVDNETQVQEAISKLVKGKTVLVIAHRMRTIEAADQIVVLDKGAVAETGNHETLMKENRLYRKLVDLQCEATDWKLRV